MMLRKNPAPRKFVGLALVAAGAILPGFVQSCDDRLIAITRYADPCGTILANCNPGDFEVFAADVGDYCVDLPAPSPVNVAKGSRWAPSFVFADSARSELLTSRNRRSRGTLDQHSGTDGGNYHCHS